MISWDPAHGIRRRPTLPGRFQPSTISVLRLNFCVRDGNRWVPQAIVTGNSRGECLLLPRFLAIRSATNGLPSVSAQIRAFRVPLCCAATLLSAPSKPHRLKIWFPLTKILPPLYSKLLCFLTNHWPLDQALDRLVSSSSIRYRTFTDDLSTLSSSRGLTCLKQWQFYSPGGLHA